jgi:hypothetical protein
MGYASMANDLLETSATTPTFGRLHTGYHATLVIMLHTGYHVTLFIMHLSWPNLRCEWHA